MAILLVQLGDIHFKTDADPVLGRASQIAAAISAEVTADVATVVLALCGDMAYAGGKSQFLTVTHFVEEIEVEVRRRRSSVSIERIVLPGNHDCDFSGDQVAREFMLTQIKEGDRPASSVRNIVLGPLGEYFHFAANFAGHDRGITEVHPFYTAVDFLDGSFRLRLHLLNTAWMSSIHEQPGSLHFPLAEISPPATAADCSFAILHHPINWFSQPHTMRPLRDLLGRMVSVVLVNHEHVPEVTEQIPLFDRDSGATRTLYVSGGVVQENAEPELCNFVTMKIDVAAKMLAVARHEYRSNNGKSFFECTANETIGISQNELSVGPAGVALTDHMVAFLSDPGAPIMHPNRDPRIPVRLVDVFLYPDLWELDAEHNGKDQKQIKSQSVSQEILATPKVLLTGGEKCGRTSIVKMLFLAAFDAGRVPVFLTGEGIPKNTEKLRKKIRDAVKEQYSNLSPDAFEQLEQANRVVLIDDAHQIAASAIARQELLDELERQFGTVVLCGDDLIKLDEMKGRDARDSNLWEYRHLIIVGFGEYLREQFVRQWLMLGGDTAPDGEILDAEVDRICSLLNVVIKKQLLPAYPLFLLVILQQSDLANASVQNGSFGKLFEGLMTAILSKSQFGRISISDKYYYLAALARRMFDEKAMSLSIDSARHWHRTYWDEIELDIDFEKLLRDLEVLGVLTVTQSEIRFKYAYFFCFFMAYHLNRTLHEASTRELISHLSLHLYHRVSADIVLFLAHLTGDPVVLDEMVKTCDRLFAGIPAANLEEDVQPLNRLGDVVGTITIPDSPDDNRREMKLQKDALVAERLAATKSNQEVVPPEADNDAIRRLFEIHAAYKTIQILGQALRNIAGSASKQRKEEVIEKLVGLSRRLLGAFFEIFGEDVLQQIIDDIATAHIEQQPELVVSEIRDQVCQHLVGLSQFVCFTVIKHTTFSVGSENLAPTIHRVLGEKNDALARILDLSFDLERPRNFPRDAALKLFKDLSKNRFSAGMVRILVAHHMYQYIVPMQDRQAVCEKMDIKLLPSVMDRKRKRLTK